jgi:type I restriction enzyme S subunit
MLRHYLINNFNVTEIISVPQDQFENTSTKTTIIIFHNNGTTDNVNFYEFKVNREPKNVFINVEGETVINKMENDIINVDKNFICNATREQISKIMITYNKKNEPKIELNYSLNYKDYMENIVKCPIGYKIIKLGQLMEFENKGKRLADFGKNVGKYNFYTCSDKIKKCNTADIKNKLCLIIGHSGNGCLFLDDNFSTLLTNHILSCKNKLDVIYIYYYLKYYWIAFYNKCYSGSTVKNTSDKNINNYEIAIPINMEIIKSELEKMFELHETINEINNLIEIKEKEIQKKIKYIIENEECEIKLLKDIIDTKQGEYITKNKMEKGEYPIYGGGGISNYINRYNNEKEIIINKDGVSLNCVKFEFKKFFLNHHGWIIIYKQKYLKNYINFWLLNNQDKIYNLAMGTAQKGINKENFLKLKIEIPLERELINLFDNYFQEIEKLKLELYKNEQLYKFNIEKMFNNFN